MEQLQLSKFLSYFFLIAFCNVSFTKAQKNFTNPITDRIAPDPQILHLGDHYYMVLSENERDMIVYKSPIITDFRNASSSPIFQPNSSYDACWAPEMHIIDGEIYCYFSMHKINENDHRMWVSKAENSSDPMGNWTVPIQLMADEAEDANDGTVFKHPTNGMMYFVFTRLKPEVHQPSLYIAPMKDAFTVLHPRVLLRIPQDGDWDCMDACLDEGAHFLYSSNNISHLIFSGSGAGGRNYALGRMSIQSDLDPLVPWNWGPVTGRIFSENEEQSIYGPGHSAFTVSPDGTETWMVYHAQNTTEYNMRNRLAYLDKIDWDADGYPVFPTPHGSSFEQTVPSGQI